MNNIILGSGIVGLLAKLILGPSWKIVPFYRSRFFSFNPALDDNFIIRDEKLDQFINDINKILKTPMLMYQRSWSIGGELIKRADKELCYSWMYKLFGNDVPSQSEAYFAGKMSMFVYDMRVNQLYQELTNLYLDELKKNSAEGQISEIGDHYYIINDKKIEYDKMVSTIPLNALLNFMNIKSNLSAKTIHYLHIETDGLNFEGANQVLVVDSVTDFFKVTNIAPNRYLFYFHKDVPNPGTYMMGYIPKFEIIDGTSIESAIPYGNTPKLDDLESKDIFCVGSSAQWDWCMDVGSCILRLLKYAERGQQANKPKTIDLL